MQIGNYIRISDSPEIQLSVVSAGSPLVKAALFHHPGYSSRAGRLALGWRGWPTASCCQQQELTGPFESAWGNSQNRSLLGDKKIPPQNGHFYFSKNECVWKKLSTELSRNWAVRRWEFCFRWRLVKVTLAELAEYFQGHFYSGNVKDQNTQKFHQNTIFMPQFWPGDVKLAKMASRRCQTQY